MTINELKLLITNTPSGPGIYRFKDENKEDIYIGKASSIKKRLTSYTKTIDPRIQKMISTAATLNHIETESDIEALILESQLIKQQRPKFNIMLRDDKQYFYVGLTKEKYPRLFLTHQPNLKSGDEFIGPFTEGSSLKSTLKYLRNIFPYCTCNQKHHNFCLNYHIGKCLGVCCLKDPELVPEYQTLSAAYKKNIKAIKDILCGKKNLLVKELKKEMTAAGKKHDFSEAIQLRNKFERLERVFYNAQVIQNSEILKSYDSGLLKLLKTKKPIIKIEGYDISNIQGQYATGAMVTFINGIPDKNLYRKFKIKTVLGANDTAMLREVIERRFNHPEWTFPDLILIDGGKGQVNTVLNTLEEMNINIPIIGVSKDEHHMGHQLIIPERKQPVPLSKLPETEKNLLLTIDTEAHRFAVSYYRNLHRKSI
jgi:excinuclease ABC subunit C